MKKLLMPGMLVALAIAATTPDFSGEWKIDAAKSSPAVPASMTRTIQHNNPRLTFTETGNNILFGDINPTLQCTTDGKDTLNTVAGHDVNIAGAWESGTLVIRLKGNFGQGEVGMVDKWTLSNGGTTLTDVQHIDAPSGQVDLTYVFTRH